MTRGPDIPRRPQPADAPPEWSSHDVPPFGASGSRPQDAFDQQAQAAAGAQQYPEVGDAGVADSPAVPNAADSMPKQPGSKSSKDPVRSEATPETGAQQGVLPNRARAPASDGPKKASPTPSGSSKASSSDAPLFLRLGPDGVYSVQSDKVPDGPAAQPASKTETTDHEKPGKPKDATKHLAGTTALDGEGAGRPEADDAAAAAARARKGTAPVAGRTATADNVEVAHGPGSSSHGDRGAAAPADAAAPTAASPTGRVVDKISFPHLAPWDEIRQLEEAERLKRAVDTSGANPDDHKDTTGERTDTPPQPDSADSKDNSPEAPKERKKIRVGLPKIVRREDGRVMRQELTATTLETVDKIWLQVKERAGDAVDRVVEHVDNKTIERMRLLETKAGTVDIVKVIEMYDHRPVPTRYYIETGGVHRTRTGRYVYGPKPINLWRWVDPVHTRNLNAAKSEEAVNRLRQWGVVYRAQQRSTGQVGVRALRELLTDSYEVKAEIRRDRARRKKYHLPKQF